MIGIQHTVMNYCNYCPPSHPDLTKPRYIPIHPHIAPTPQVLLYTLIYTPCLYVSLYIHPYISIYIYRYVFLHPLHALSIYIYMDRVLVCSLKALPTNKDPFFYSLFSHSTRGEGTSASMLKPMYRAVQMGFTLPVADQNRTPSPKWNRHCLIWNPLLERIYFLDPIRGLGLEKSRTWKGDRIKDLQTLAMTITEAKKNPFRYVESREIKQLRAEAMRQRRTPAARALWKEVWKRKKRHKEQWHRELLQEVLRNNWHALQAVKRNRKPTMWSGSLTAEEGWQKRMKTHFESIFSKQEGGEVRRQVDYHGNQGCGLTC